MSTLLPFFGFRAANERRPPGNIDGDTLSPRTSSGAPAAKSRACTLLHLSTRRPRAAAEAATFDDAELHAYVDACLDARRRARLEAELARHPEAGLVAAAYRLLNINLHRLFDRDLPPLSAALQALSCELDRRLGASARTRLGGLAATAVERGRRFDPAAAVGRVADAIRRALLASVAVVASFVALVGLTWPLVAGQPLSCAQRVETLVKSLAKRSLPPELGERLAATGLLCGAGDPGRAETELARLEYETRRFGK